MPKNKSPGPDGFPIEFFQSAWKVAGGQLIKAILEVFQTEKLLKETNATLITLVPKILKPKRVSNFRSISCCNITYK